MSKKRFTDGLESLFGLSAEKESLPEESPLLAETDVEVKTSPPRKKKKKGRSSKNFTSDLDSLFEDVLQEKIEEKKEQVVAKKVNRTPIAKSKRKSSRPVSGLDALIRRTLETGEAEINYEQRKRVTFVFEKNKIDKLKSIAKSQKMYMKDILKDIVEEYIEEFEKTGGTLN